MFFSGIAIKMKLIESCESHSPLAKLTCISKELIHHAFSVCRVTVKPNKSYSVHIGITKGRGVQDTLTLSDGKWANTISSPVIHIHQWHTGSRLDGLHPSPGITHYSCRLSSTETRSGALHFTPLCVYASVSVNLEGGVLVQSAAVGTAGIEPVCQRDALRWDLWPVKSDAGYPSSCCGQILTSIYHLA